MKCEQKVEVTYSSIYYGNPVTWEY